MNVTSIEMVSTGSALPQACWPNAALIAARGLDSSPEWIESRTGIRQRYIAGTDESTASLATAAVQQALQRAGVQPTEVGVLVVATCTPDRTFPSVAALVHGALDLAPVCTVLDVNAACSGFIHALAVARGLLLTSEATVAVVVGAETFSRVVDWADRSTCVLFGDGAGAVVLRKNQTAAPTGLLALELGADGAQAGLLQSSGGTSLTQTAGVVQMQGREVFKHAVRQMGDRAAVDALVAPFGLTVAQVDWVVPHQANARILEAAGAALGVPPEKVVMTVDQHANTSAASIPLALDTAVQDGRIQRGQLLLLQAFGAGFAWSNALVRF